MLQNNFRMYLVLIERFELRECKFIIDSKAKKYNIVRRIASQLIFTNLRLQEFQYHTKVSEYSNSILELEESEFQRFKLQKYQFY